MGKITTAVFEPGSTTANVYGLWQYSYGQTLQIQGLHLPSMVAIHFSLQETGGTALNRVGVTKDGVTEVRRQGGRVRKTGRGLGSRPGRSPRAGTG